MLIFRHAGYQYSGKIASSAFEAVRGYCYQRIFVIGPSHYSNLGSSIGLSYFGELECPLGVLNVDTQLNRMLLNAHSNLFHSLSPERELEEHSLEMQFPFIYHVFGNCIRVVPMLMSSVNAEAIAALKVHFEGALVVVSSDFCHWGRRFGFRPMFSSSLDAGILQLNMQAIEIIKRGKAEEFEEYLHESGNTICGKVPLLFALRAMKLRGKLVNYGCSGKVHSAEDSSVSYAAIVMNKE